MTKKLSIALLASGTIGLGLLVYNLSKNYLSNKEAAEKMFEEESDKFETCTHFIIDELKDDEDIINEFSYLHSYFKEMIEDSKTPERMKDTLDFIFMTYNNILEVLDEASDNYKFIVSLMIRLTIQELKIRKMTSEVEKLSDKVTMNFSGNLGSVISR